MAVRGDVGVVLTLLPHLWNLMKGAFVASKVEGSFKDVSKNFITDKFLVS